MADIARASLSEVDSSPTVSFAEVSRLVDSLKNIKMVDVLETLARNTGSFGAALWERGPNSSELYVLASWFPVADPFFVADLPIDASATGTTIKSGKLLRFSDVSRPDQGGVGAKNEFVVKHAIGPMICLPITMASGSAGALNLYRRRTDPAFDSKDEVRLKNWSPIVSKLEGMIADRRRQVLSQKIADYFLKPDSLPSDKSLRSGLEQICALTAEAMTCFEVSIFLRESLQGHGPVTIQATTCRELVPHPTYLESDPGITAWVLKRGSTVRIVDVLSGRGWPMQGPRHDQARYQYCRPLVGRLRGVASGELDSPASCIVAPIIVNNTMVGVMRCAAATVAPFVFSAEDAQLVELAGRMVARVLQGVLESRQRLRELDQTHRNLFHQIKGPISQAKQYCELASKSVGGFSELPMVRGLCAKALRVARNLGVLADLSQGRPLRINSGAVDAGWLTKSLIEAAADWELVNPRGRGRMRIHVDRESIDVPQIGLLDIDPDLFEQAIGILLDNAIKYGHDRTTVHVSVALTKNQNVSFLVANVGLTLHASEVSMARQRGWRSQEAESVVGEGSGLGLWIADGIMKAHGGELVITPTDGDGRTVVGLVFPIT